ncbi:creatininase family protein [Desulfosarcina variabilis]|uniref:creatininase family protein n=1 Tax=Desulfosarcina variabilis TaxID=2300 RepID=UPI003AFA402E
MADEKISKANSENDPLSALVVFDRLEVGPVKLEPKRLVAPYRLVTGGNTEQTELIYTYEEAVFDPDTAESRNLADMIAAQVALNYGLFCREIVYNGLFDKTDRQFLRDMAENTAREIYVKKFLEPNPFLVGAVVGLPATVAKSYLKARLVFPRSPRVVSLRPWHPHADRHCVLSSGGKDSLLSFGLMDELGCDVHPIFVNESGRHWFTALNAYRHFRDNIPGTARVWVNADRFFAWMLRRMPFIRKDFASLRADEYPIRLWTVAVFLFGVLPLMQKRGIGRLIIGDEFDTSRRITTSGIRHYDGLYDQSRWFDDALSRYFMRKGWSIAQFSILRPLSELLIEKILVKRYPHLQEHQTSCHATHKKDDRIRPCGRCEKCRRIVGMLTALAEDPTRCGYTTEQIHACLNDLFKKGVYSQASAEAGQLFYLLSQIEHIKIPDDVVQTVKEYPEILQLRFDPKVSPINGIPADLRTALYRIYLEYADGAVEAKGKGWQPIDALTHPALKAPYAFDTGERHTPAQPEADTSSGTYFWGELCWPQAARRLDIVDTALLPVGAVEQHGPHLPLDTDAFDAEYLARQVAEGCSDPKPLVLPLIAYGVSYHHEAFKGTISINNDTLANLVYDVGISVAKNGIKKLVIINGHGGNAPSLNFAAQRINQDARIFVCVDTGETSDVDVDNLIETPNDVHAGEIETSTSLAIRPHLVRMDHLQMEVPTFTSRYLDFSSKRGVSWYAHTHKISSSGVMGDPTKASREKGQKMWAMMISHLVSFVDQLKQMTLKEIYQRKY